MAKSDIGFLLSCRGMIPISEATSSGSRSPPRNEPASWQNSQSSNVRAGSARKVCNASGPSLRMYQRPMLALLRGSNPSCPRRPIMSRPRRPIMDRSSASRRSRGRLQTVDWRFTVSTARTHWAPPPARSRPTSPRHPQRPRSDARSRPVEQPGLVSSPLHTYALKCELLRSMTDGTVGGGWTPRGNCVTIRSR